MPAPVLAAVGQLCSTANVAHNTRLCTSIIRRAAAAQAQLVFLPEASDFIAPPDVGRKLVEPLEGGKFVEAMKRQAKESKIWVGVGVHEKATEEKCYNTNLLISPEGEIKEAYRKLHLFDVHSQVMESNSTLKGDKLCDPVETAIGKVGLQTCYDLRFAETALMLRRKGADIITYPAAFTTRSGPPHWEVLLRARAIETQCYVFAPAQVGQHSETRSSYGHAMVISPWGDILAQAADRFPQFPPHEDDDDVGQFVLAEIELGWMDKLRKDMPLWEQRRGDVYPIL